MNPRELSIDWQGAEFLQGGMRHSIHEDRLFWVYRELVIRGKSFDAIVTRFVFISLPGRLNRERQSAVADDSVNV